MARGDCDAAACDGASCSSWTTSRAWWSAATARSRTRRTSCCGCDDVPAAARSLLRPLGRARSHRADQAAGRRGVNVALTATGIAALSPGGTTLPAGFAEPFADGMNTAYRSRILGDIGPDDPAAGCGAARPPTRSTLLLLLYADDAGPAGGLGRRGCAAAAEHGRRGPAAGHRRTLTDREPFGFRDGLSQPTHRRAAGGATRRRGAPARRVRARLPQRVRPARRAPAARPRRTPTGCCRRTRPGRAADLGRNGSYLVFRQLRQDVEGSGATSTATPAARRDGRAGRREQLAAQLVGRWPSGAPAGAQPRRGRPRAGATPTTSATTTPDPDGPALPGRRARPAGQPARLAGAAARDETLARGEPPAPAAPPRPQLRRRRASAACTSCASTPT